MKTLSVTGHRPQSLWGFDTTHPSYQKLREDLDTLLAQAYGRGFRVFLSGGAQGVDTIFAEAALDLRAKYSDVKVWVAIPFVGQERIWPEPAQQRYRRILAESDYLYVVSEGMSMTLEALSGQNDPIPYHKVVQALYQRNEWMVDNSDALLAVWNGRQDGGSYHCLSYAMKWGKFVIRYNPLNGEITRLKETS